MSAIRGRKGEDRSPREGRAAPDPPVPEPGGEDEPIEIIEVVGVDEDTGTAPDTRPPAARRRHAAAETPVHSPATGGGRELEEAIRDKEKYYDLLLRKQAEFENYRKRIEKERAEGRSSAAVELVRRLLPALDNLERGLRSSEASSDPLRQGVVLIHQQLLDALRKEGLQPIESLGASFDPQFHEAVEVLDVDGFEQGVVLEEMQKGYTFNGRLLRPALVKVASGKGTRAEGSPADPGA
jgi:molecular chaperone GrpE